MACEKLYILGNVHSDRNQIEVVRYLTELLSSDEWVIGCEFGANEALEGSLQESRASFEKHKTSLSEALPMFQARFTFKELFKMKSDRDLGEKDSVFYYRLNSPSQAQNKEKLIMAFMNCRWKLTLCKTYEVLKKSSFQVLGVEDEMLMDQHASTVNELIRLGHEILQSQQQQKRVIKSKEKEHQQSLISKQLNLENQRNQAVISNAIEYIEKYGKNILVMIGAQHVIDMKKLFESSEGVQASYCFIRPEKPITPFGECDERLEKQSSFIKECEENGVTIIDIQQNGWRQELISLTKSNSAVSSGRLRFTFSVKDEVKDEVLPGDANNNLK